MSRLDIRPLSDDLPFGARVGGVGWDVLGDEVVRQELRELFEDRGMIVFEDMEPSDDLQLELSKVFGPLQDHAIKNMQRIDGANKPGLVNLGDKIGKATVVEVDGRQLANFVSWHFDACYTEKLNRAGVLRIVEQPPEGGRTGFADGIQIYDGLPQEWRDVAENLEIVYFQGNMHHRQRFGLPGSWRLVQYAERSKRVFREAENLPRAIHPAVWQRPSGEKVLHVSPWQADGIAGRDDPEGDALLRELVEQIYKAMTPYWHDWEPTDMIIWDNWRFVHSAGGYDPRYARDAHRTTIKGDYGLGRFEPMAERPARCENVL